jgi:hypothetical protein
MPPGGKTVVVVAVTRKDMLQIPTRPECLVPIVTRQVTK